MAARPAAVAGAKIVSVVLWVWVSAVGSGGGGGGGGTGREASAGFSGGGWERLLMVLFPGLGFRGGSFFSRIQPGGRRADATGASGRAGASAA